MSQVIADLQLHSKYSRAVSKDMVIPVMAEWGRKKGIDLLATGDWTHSLWMVELQSQLQEVSPGIFVYGGEGSQKAQNETESTEKTRFLLSTEISSIYTQGGRVRRVHTLIFAPNFMVARKINDELLGRGCNLSSDGRPIVGLSCRQLAEIVLGVDEKCLLIPAHCLLPKEMIMTQDGIKEIGQVKKNELVLTHKGRYRKVEKVLKRKYEGEMIRIRPWYFSLGLATTPEHPYYAIRTVKKCRSTGDVCRPFGRHINHCQAKHYLDYKQEWLPAGELATGDILLYPVFRDKSNLAEFKISNVVNGLVTEKNRVKLPGGRALWINNEIKFDADFGRLVGYYLAEGYIYGPNGIGFCFSQLEDELVEDIKKIVRKVFGVNKFRQYYRKRSGGVELSFSSEILTRLFKKWFYGGRGTIRANNKALPNWMLSLNPRFQAEILIGWWRGDRGYTASRELMNQMRTICLRLKAIPGIGVHKVKDHQKKDHYSQIEGRKIRANHDLYYLSRLAFIEDKFRLTERLRDKRLVRKLDRKHGWVDENYAYLPIRKVEKIRYEGDVYNLEVKQDNSYVAEFACVHNCWTPWFSLYGSKGGFDSIEECFGEFSNKIYAVETGLSSDPVMNWRIKELEKRAIMSFSDAHSPAKLGREATVFKGDKNFSYNDIYWAIASRYLDRNDGNLEIDYTIEFYPEEGKYHYTGHRKCGVKQEGITCPVCGRSLTRGVLSRVQELADGEVEAAKKINQQGVMFNYHPADETRPPYAMMVPLQEILAQVHGVGVGSKQVQLEYERLIGELGGEFQVLLATSIERLVGLGGDKLAAAIDRVRRQEISIDPGYDGEYGKVSIWSDEPFDYAQGKQMGLF